MKESYSDYANIGKFISNTNGNWRNCIYITCSVCDKHQNDVCDDVLLSFGVDGRPCFIMVKDANKVFSTVVDKSECILELSNAKCRCIFEQMIKKHCPSTSVCPFLSLVKITELV